MARFLSCSCVLCSVTQLCPTCWSPMGSLSMEFSRQEYWSGLPFPIPGDLLNPGIEPTSVVSPALAGEFFTTVTIWEAQLWEYFPLFTLFLMWKKVKVLVTQSCLTLPPRELQPSRLLCPWNSPGKNTGVDSHFILQGLFPIQGWNLGLLHCWQTLYCLSHQESPFWYKRNQYKGKPTE